MRNTCACVYKYSFKMITDVKGITSCIYFIIRAYMLVSHTCARRILNARLNV